MRNDKEEGYGNDTGELAMGEVRLRRYRTGDADAMHALDVVCFAPAFQFSRRAMRQFAEAKGAVTVLAEAADHAGAQGLAGFGIVQVEERIGYVVTLDVAEEWRRRGLARRLMEEMEQRAREAGAKQMALHVFTGNEGAIRFYEAIGYRSAGTVEGFYGRGLDAWVYWKGLTR